MKKALLSITFLISLLSLVSAQLPTIVLDPAGDAKTLGRKLKDGYERGATLKLAERIAQELHSVAHVVISRRPGESIKPLEVASFANRLHARAVVNINICHTNHAKPFIHVYHFCYNPFTELSKQMAPNKISFVPVHQAHLFSMQETKKIVHHLHKQFTQSSNAKLFSTQPPIALPFKSLKGISSPALAIEIGVNDEDKLEGLITPLAKSLKAFPPLNSYN